MNAWSWDPYVPELDPGSGVPIVAEQIPGQLDAFPDPDDPDAS